MEVRKKIYGFILFIATVLFIPNSVLAADVAEIGSDKYDDLKKAINAANSGDTIKLLDNIDYGSTAISYGIAIQKNITIDLNGFELSANANYGIFYVYGATLTINDTSDNKTGKITSQVDGIDINNGGTLIVNGGTIYGNNTGVYLLDQTSKEKGSKIILNDGIIQGNYYGIGVFSYNEVTINGGTVSAKSGYPILNNGEATGPTTITINGGEITQIPNNHAAIYHPGLGTLTINGGTIQGGTGIEMRSGTLNIPETSTAIIKGNASPTSITSNGSGATSRGAGIAISQHTTGNEISVNIQGGSISGFSAVYESNPEGNSEAATEKVNINIAGGTFKTQNGGAKAIYSENHDSFITGGTYSTTLEQDYIAGEYEDKTINGNTVVGKPIEINPNLVNTNTTQGALHVANQQEVMDYLYNYIKNINDPKLQQILQENFVELEIQFTEVTNIDQSTKDLLQKALNKNAKLSNYYDITIAVKVNGQTLYTLKELDKKIKLTLTLSENITKAPEGYKRVYYVLYYHDGTVQKVDASLSEDGKSVEFESNQYSLYTVAYEDIAVPSNPKTSDSISLYTILAISAVIAVAAALIVARKKELFN